MPSSASEKKNTAFPLVADGCSATGPNNDASKSAKGGVGAANKVFFFFLMTRGPPRSTLFPSTTLFRSRRRPRCGRRARPPAPPTDLRKRLTTQFRSEEHTSELQSPCNLLCPSFL